MSKIKPLLLLFLVFFAGIVVGVVGTRAVVRRMVREAIENPERMQAFIERRLDRRLRLDGDQRDKLHDILVNTHQQLKDLRLEFRPQFALIIAGAETNIDAILTPEQRERFEKLKAENPMIWQPGLRKE